MGATSRVVPGGVVVLPAVLDTHDGHHAHRGTQNHRQQNVVPVPGMVSIPASVPWLSENTLM